MATFIATQALFDTVYEFLFCFFGGCHATLIIFLLCTHFDYIPDAACYSRTPIKSNPTFQSQRKAKSLSPQCVLSVHYEVIVSQPSKQNTALAAVP